MTYDEQTELLCYLSEYNTHFYGDDEGGLVDL